VQKKLFLFDLDWTLVYTGGAGVRALNYAFENLFGVANGMGNVSPDGKTDPAIIREMIRVHLGREAADGEIERCCKGYVDRLRVEVHGPGYIILPGIPALLETLSRKPDILLGLGTGNLSEGARAKLERANLYQYFKFGGFADDSEDRPELLRAAVRRAELLAGGPFPPGHVFVLGDNFRDIVAGQAIGAVTVGVATGHMKEEELAPYKPDYLFKDLSDTEKVLDTLLSHDPQPR
jgi:phosphoglycolate phosphatase